MLTFNSGAGDYILDISGELQRDATVTIETGLSNIILVIPDDTHAIVTVERAACPISTLVLAGNKTASVMSATRRAHTHHYG